MDLEREAARQEHGPAMDFLSSVPENRLHIALITAGEIGVRCGQTGPGRLGEALPLVTRNVDEFRRVPDLEVVRY